MMSRPNYVITIHTTHTHTHTPPRARARAHTHIHTQHAHSGIHTTINSYRICRELIMERLSVTCHTGSDISHLCVTSQHQVCVTSQHQLCVTTQHQLCVTSQHQLCVSRDTVTTALTRRQIRSLKTQDLFVYQTYHCQLEIRPCGNGS